MTLLEQAIAFREAYDQEMLDGMVRYGFVKEKLFDMQAGLIEEESNEFLEACKDLRDAANTPANHFEVLKELSDLVFVCYQFAAAYGLDLDTAMERVFESNMSKLVMTENLFTVKTVRYSRVLITENQSWMT